MELDESKLVRIGRPQLDLRPEPTLPASERATVLYAPTREGDADYNCYTSVDVFGPQIVRGLLAVPGVRVVYKPHPKVTTSEVPAVVAGHRAILDVLAGSPEPLNGYQLIQQIADRTEGAWKPSPGSVYPTIAWLQDEGFVEDAPTGRKTLQLTDSGRQYVADHADELAAIWPSFDHDVPEDSADLRQVIGQTVGAIVQVASTGTPDQRDKAVKILAETRRRLYSLLAEGPEDADTDTDEE